MEIDKYVKGITRNVGFCWAANYYILCIAEIYIPSFPKNVLGIGLSMILKRRPIRYY